MSLAFRFALLTLFFFNSGFIVYSQSLDYLIKEEDRLKGRLDKNRSCYDVLKYDLTLLVQINKNSIVGTNTFTIKPKFHHDTLRFDLSDSLNISMIEWEGKSKLTFYRYLNTVFFIVPEKLDTSKVYSFKVNYYGRPKIAENPPWDGGFIWAYDSLNNSPWVSVACQGDGASLWWPCKDHLSDKPNEMKLTYIVPDSLKAIGNGQFLGNETDQKIPNGYKAHTWKISYPINTYNVALYVGEYVDFHDFFESEAGLLRLNYYVLKGNDSTAKEHFLQVKPMLKAYEELFGPYTFINDGYALVEAPFWGMEHQSAIAYGNGFENNQWDFDFIIIHESGHEYWGNTISIEDHGELWIHEAFCTYAEALYLEKTQSKERAQLWLNYQRKLIENKMPILGPLEVNFHDWPDADMYYKGTWMLHTLRHSLDNDSLWFSSLKKLILKYKNQSVNTHKIIEFFEQETKLNLRPWFSFYLNTTKIPELQLKYTFEKGKTKIEGRFTNTPAGFGMFLVLGEGESKKRIWFDHSLTIKEFEGEIQSLLIKEEHYYIKVTD